MIKDSGTRREFETGAVRDIQEGKGRCDLLPLDAVMCLMRKREQVVLADIECFKRYGNVNCLRSCLESFAYCLSDGKTTYNACISTMLLDVSKHFEEGAKKYGEYNWQKGIPTHCCIWTCKNKPELNDYPRKESNDDG